MRAAIPCFFIVCVLGLSLSGRAAETADFKQFVQYRFASKNPKLIVQLDNYVRKNGVKVKSTGYPGKDADCIRTLRQDKLWYLCVRKKDIATRIAAAVYDTAVPSLGQLPAAVTMEFPTQDVIAADDPCKGKSCTNDGYTPCITKYDGGGEGVKCYHDVNPDDIVGDPMHECP